MARGARFNRRLRYWFDNTMSRGTASLVGWLAIVSVVMVVVVTIALEIVSPPDADGRPPNPFAILWQTFASTFSLDVPETGTLAVLALWFVLGVGGIFIVSALIGLLTSGVNLKLEQLRKGRSVVVERDHTVILGWSDQVFTVVSELVEANRSRRRAAITILAEHDKVDMEDQLRRRIPDTGTTRLVCRTGSPLDLTDLELVNPNEARSIIVLAPASERAEDADSYVLKVLLAINRGPAFRDRRHHVVASVRDGRNRAVARLAGGDAVVVDADDISARLLVQTARQSGLSVIYQDLLDFGGDEFYVISEPRLVGYQFGQVLSAYQQCCPVGIVHASGTAVLNPPMNTVIEPQDRLAILAQDDSAIRLTAAPFPVDEAAILSSVRGPQAPERTLVLGWNGRATRIIEQLDIYVTAGSVVDVVTDRKDAAAAVARVGLGLRQLTVTVTEGDTRDRNVLEGIEIVAYDNVIVLSDDVIDPLTADARVLVTLLHLRDMLEKRGKAGSIVSEMRDDRDRALAQLTRADDFVISEQLVSLLMTQISENRHLESVFTDLFDSAGAEIYVRPSMYYVRSVPGLTFATVVESARRRGEVAIGYRMAEPGEGNHGIVLNPDKTQVLPPIDRLIVLAQG
ncbi:CASTOR/POLLUX-related putative ion channel [Luedemannella helvata]|uniref:Lipoprotein n=1 Tax=Luedemannella helvata TaxID=349315 RepID=A0ABP4XAS2_9ACTN